MTNVKVYRNLHKNCYSVLKDGVVIAHAPTVTLANPKFTVRPAGRDKVRATGRKNVHAFVSGELVGVGETPSQIALDRAPIVRYNPYKNDTFVVGDDSLPVGNAVMSDWFAHLDDTFNIHVWW